MRNKIFKRDGQCANEKYKIIISRGRLLCSRTCFACPGSQYIYIHEHRVVKERFFDIILFFLYVNSTHRPPQTAHNNKIKISTHTKRMSVLVSMHETRSNKCGDNMDRFLFFCTSVNLTQPFQFFSR